MAEDADFFKRLLATFRLEAREHVDALFAGVGALEHASDEVERAQLVETIFREAHSLKGAARSVSQSEVESLCQSLETTFSAMKRNEMAATQSLFDHLHATLHRLDAMLGDESSAASAAEAVPATEKTTERPPAKPEKPTVGDTVRVATDKLGAIFMQAEEMLSAKLLVQQRRQELSAMQTLVANWNKEWTNFTARQADLQPDSELHPLWREMLEQNTAFIKNLNYQLNAITRSTDQDQRMIGRMVDDLLEDMKKALMQPFSTVLEIFPRLVRDLARDHGKEIELVIRGDELEADRRILEAIKDPLIHLVRNSVDHGIETPEERLRRQKPKSGRIVIAIMPRNGNRVEIVVSDDGAGIDTDKVRATAQKLGLVSPEEVNSLGEDATMELIYHSGVSTSPILTEISGRGLGLAIVREKVDRLGGQVITTTHAQTGTSFRILLPLTLATYRGITVCVGEQIFVLPTSHVELTARMPRSEVFTAGNRETVRINGATLSLVWLGDILGLTHTQEADDPFLQIALLQASGKHIAFVVDEVLNEQEVLVKNLGRQLARVRNIAAATILGSGKAVPILNVSDLIKSALQAPASRNAPATAAQDRERREKRVLVVEDSITARNLIKGILELAGYQVGTAVDGVDGYTQLRSGNYDIVVSDVEMPRMSGFDLTAKIRSDQKLAHLPVILVTALESREDRERGIDVGADAYIVKRSFEQSDLLEVIGRLI